VEREKKKNIVLEDKISSTKMQNRSRIQIRSKDTFMSTMKQICPKDTSPTPKT